MESGSVVKGLIYGGFASCVAETGECIHAAPSAWMHNAPVPPAAPPPQCFQRTLQPALCVRA
jgi:hypothetical protein